MTEYSMKQKSMLWGQNNLETQDGFGWLDTYFWGFNSKPLAPLNGLSLALRYVTAFEAA